MRPERRLSGRNDRGGFGRPVETNHSGATALNPGVAGAEPPPGSWHAFLIARRRSQTRLAEYTREPNVVVSDYKRARGIRQYWSGLRGNHDIRFGTPPRISAFS